VKESLPEVARPANQLALERLLPGKARAAWERAFVTFACDEINGLYDRAAEALGAGNPVPAALKARLGPMLEALSWDREATIPSIWQIARRKPDRPEDAFAPALVLLALLPDDPEAAAWVAERPAPVRQVVAALAV
jgi:hypothetical protein